MFHGEIKTGSFVNMFSSLLVVRQSIAPCPILSNTNSAFLKGCDNCPTRKEWSDGCAEKEAERERNAVNVFSWSA